MITKSDFKKGEFIALSMCTYDDWTIQDFAVARKDFNVSEVRKIFRQEFKPTKDRPVEYLYRYFPEWLFKKGYVGRRKALDEMTELWCGEYGSFPK